MKLFVTGGSGFVGGALITAMRDQHQVLAMARSDEAAAAVAALGAEPVRCSLAEVTPSHLPGVEAVVHCAGYVRQWGPVDEYRRANVEGTANVIAAARGAGARRVVHISTESVLFAGRHLREMDETWPYPVRTPYPYCQTKGEAERLALAANDEVLETIVLRPVLVWGPGDQTILPEVVAMAESGRFVWVDQGRHRVSPTHIDNVTHGIRLALEGGKPGEVYFVTDGETPAQRDFLTRYAATAGVNLPSRSIPGWMARLIGSASTAAWKVTRPGREPPLTPFAAALLASEITVASDKASRELGYEPVVTVERGMARLAAG